MSEAPEPIIEEETKNINEEATKETPPETNEATTQQDIKNEVKQEENANEEQFKNKTDRMKNKKVNCKDCGANLTLKTLRYSHKCSKLEDKPITPKPRAKAKVKAVPIQPVNNEVIHQQQPTILKEVIQEPKQPVIKKSPYEQLMDSYSVIHQEYLNKRREKVNNLTASMFSGDLRKKKR